MNRALCELGKAKPPLDNHSPVCQFFGMEVSSLYNLIKSVTWSPPCKINHRARQSWLAWLGAS